MGRFMNRCLVNHLSIGTSVIDSSQSNFTINYEKVLVRAYISLSPVIDDVEVQHPNVLEIIIMVFSLYKLLNQIGFTIIKRRSRLILENYVTKQVI
jgi:hypothetical protein